MNQTEGILQLFFISAIFVLLFFDILIRGLAEIYIFKIHICIEKLRCFENINTQHYNYSISVSTKLSKHLSNLKYN